ncbi:MAG: hypothetical protein PVI57_03465 [Gemmatimonadota bacterium]|jgi:hypothetical protein
MKGTKTTSRRTFLGLLTAGAASLALGATEAVAATGSGGPGVHPEPRPGVDGSRVLEASEVEPHLAELFDAVREIPGVIDGIGCHCGCSDLPGMYSLLSCYEESAMARYCNICQGEGRLAVRLHAEGVDLDGIRARIDRRFG